MKRYSTYIFDLDGTITDTMAVWIQIFRDCLNEIGVDASQFTDDHIAKHTHSWEATKNLGVTDAHILKVTALAHEMANKRLPGAALFPGAYETLQTIRQQGNNLAIYSTMDRPIFEPAIRHHKLHEVVQLAVAGTDVPNRKPAPDGIFKVLDDLGIPEEAYGSVMYMGDKDTDIQAAHNAGVDAILFFPAAHQLIYDKAATLAHKPHAVITDWQEVMETLK